MSKLPYLASPGNVPKALEAIKKAATPPRVSQDFVKQKLGIPGSSGDQMTSFLKRIGFASADGSPTDRYKNFRSMKGGSAMADAIREAYSDLYDHNEYMHECEDAELKDLIIQVSGLEAEARQIGLIFSTLSGLLESADFEVETPLDLEQQGTHRGTHGHDTELLNQLVQQTSPKQAPVGLNIGYTINLNLPETTNIEVFNAIFKSLKEHLLREEDV